jgi:hypothetical protein
MRTSGKPTYIDPVKADYANLGEEILDLHTKQTAQETSIGDVKTEFVTVKQDVQSIKDLDLENINAPLLQELEDARGPYSSLSERFQYIDSFDILRILEKLSTSRTYEYDSEGYIVKEIVRGDLNYNVVYKYDSSRNITREERYDVNDVLLGYKDYTYDDIGQIRTVSGQNSEDIAIATNTLITDLLDARVKSLESIDFVKLAGQLQGSDVMSLLNSVQELLTRVQNLEMYLPGNENRLIEIGSVLDRLDAIEHRLDTNYITYTFDATSDVTEYDIPAEISSNYVIYLEGVLLDEGDDYIMENGKIKFLIPLIDGFTVTCRY